MIRSVALPSILILLLVSTIALAAEDKTISLGDAGTLHVSLPQEWKVANDGSSPVTVKLTALPDKHVSIQLTPMPMSIPEAKLKMTAKRVGDGYASGSKEKQTTLEEIKGDGVHGYVASFTDASADPGEFRFVTAGVLLCGKTTLAVTLLYNDKTSADHTAALDALKSLSIVAATAERGAATAPAAAVLKVKSPDGKWTLALPGTWKVADDSKSPDGKSRQLTATSEDGAMLTLFLEPAAKPGGDAKAARAFYLSRMKQNPIPMEHLKQDAVGEVATLEYDQGTDDLKEHNLNAYLSHAGVWVDVHYSKASFDEKTDRKTITALVKGLKAMPE